MRYFEETSLRTALAMANEMEQAGEESHLGILVDSVTEDAADIPFLFKQFRLNLRAGEKLLRF